MANNANGPLTRILGCMEDHFPGGDDDGDGDGKSLPKTLIPFGSNGQ